MGADLHHVKTRKSGGTDDDYNLMPLCRSHHTECHKIGTSTFVKKYNSPLLGTTTGTTDKTKTSSVDDNRKLTALDEVF